MRDFFYNGEERDGCERTEVQWTLANNYLELTGLNQLIRLLLVRDWLIIN
jgi:hypothetical protein